jgi:SAM-dependent methyltransferase
MNSNLWQIKRELPKGSRIFEIDATIRFFSGYFLKKSLSKLAKDLLSLSPRKVALNIFWLKESLVANNRLAIREFIKILKKNNINISINLPLCLPGWKDYNKIKELIFFTSCKTCIFKKTNTCFGLTPVSYQRPILFNLPIKDFNQITLRDFFSDKNKDPLTWWIPTRADIERLVRLAEILNQDSRLPCILDVGAGSGFLGYLLAKTGRVEVIGVEPNKDLIRKTRFKHKNMKLINSRIESFNPHRRIEVVINSFMPCRLNFSPLIKRNIKPKAVVYILGKKMAEERKYVYINLRIDEKKERFEYRIAKRLSFDPNDGYKEMFRWNVYSPDNVDREKITSRDCEIEVQLRKDIDYLDKDLVFNANPKKEYRWEKQISRKRT